MDAPLPEIPETNASKSGRESLIALARRENLTVGQLAQLVGGYGGLQMVGTPASIADQMEEWLVSRGCDGFNVMFPYVPGGLDDFVDLVVPELQRRGIFRREYAGGTLREISACRDQRTASFHPIDNALSTGCFNPSVSPAVSGGAVPIIRLVADGVEIDPEAADIRLRVERWAGGAREHVALVPASRERNSDQVETNGRSRIRRPSTTAW